MTTEPKLTRELVETVAADCVARCAEEGWSTRLGEFRAAWDTSANTRRVIRRLLLANLDGEAFHPDEFFSVCLSVMLMLGWQARGNVEECGALEKLLALEGPRK